MMNLRRINRQFFLCFLMMLATSTVFAWPWGKSPDDKKEKSSTPAAVQINQKKLTAKIPQQISKGQKNAVKMASSAEVKNLAQTQQQINEILRIQKTLKGMTQKDRVEVQRINESARLHQRILKGIGKSPAGTYKPVDAQEILRQEKIRLIQEETLKNRSILENMRKKSSIAKPLNVSGGIGKIPGQENSQSKTKVPAQS